MPLVSPAFGPQIFNLTLTNAGQEYSQVLHDGSEILAPVKKIQVRLQNSTYTLQYAFVSGGPYFDLLAGETYWQDELQWKPATLYFKSPNAGAIVDIEVWF